MNINQDSVDNNNLIFLMEKLEKDDQEKINTMMEKIRIKQKYERLSKMVFRINKIERSYS